MSYNAYTLKGGDVIFVAVNVPVARFTPTVSTEDVVQMDPTDWMPDLFTSSSPAPAPVRPAKAKRQRTQRHPRTPKKFWGRRRLVMERGLQAAAEAEGVTPSAVGGTAKHYGWKVAYKRTPKKRRGDK